MSGIKSFKIFKIIKDFSSSENPMTCNDIIAKWNCKFEESAPTRATIGTTIEDINYMMERYYDCPCFIKRSDSKYKKGWYIKESISPSILRLITDAVCSFPFISQYESERIVEVLNNLNGEDMKNKNSYLKCYGGIKFKKSENKNVLFNIKKIDEAIKYDMKISFDYMKYNADKQRVLHRKYIVSPLFMAYSNRRYYLTAIKDGEKRTFRLDKIDNLKYLDIKRESLKPKFTISDFFESVVNGFSGERERISFYCDEDKIDIVIDEFGKDINIYKRRDGRLEVSVDVNANGFKLWALSHVDYIEVFYPNALREDIIRLLKMNRYGV